MAERSTKTLRIAARWAGRLSLLGGISLMVWQNVIYWIAFAGNPDHSQAVLALSPYVDLVFMSGLALSICGCVLLLLSLRRDE